MSDQALKTALQRLITEPAAPVDTTDPHAIAQRLASIEDALARLQSVAAEIAYQRIVRRHALDEAEKSIEPQGANAEARKHHVASVLGAKFPNEVAAKVEAEAHYAACEKAHELLDSRRSILQSALKLHLREQEARFGQGAGPQQVPRAA